METQNHCFKCFRSSKACLCSSIVPISTKTFFVILMHPKEFKRERLGTGRLAHISLLNSKIIVGADFTGSAEVNELIVNPNYRPFVLYPGPTSHNISTHGPIKANEGETINNSRQDLVFILDATWTCARKMMKLSKNLQNLTQLSFTPTTLSQFGFKKQPNDLCLSTIEVIHTFISQWENPSPPFAHNQLLEVFQKMVQFQTNYASNPNYRGCNCEENSKTPRDKTKKAKRWESRNLFFGKRTPQKEQ